MAESSRSDHIGRIGENFFHSLADKAKLLVGTVNPDRIGKDRIIEFELATRDSNQPFDKRLPPLKCAIQIKTVLETTNRVSLALSVAERLIGDPVATFIVILKVNNDDDVTEMHLLHLLDEPIARILRRLREEYAKGTVNLNKPTISFSIKDGMQIDLTPAALTQALQSAIGADIEAYASVKASQRKNAGFDEVTRFSLTTTFTVKNLDELTDGMLGLRPLPASNMKFFEERFKIKLQDENFLPAIASKGTFHFSPISNSFGTVVISTADNSDYANLPCDYYFACLPDMPSDSFKARVKTKLFNLIISNGEFSIKQNSSISFNDKHSLYEWLHLLKAWKILQGERCNITLQRDGYPSLNLPASTTSNYQSDYWHNYILLVERYTRIRKAAQSADQTVSLKEIIDFRNEIEILDTSITTPEKLDPFSFTIKPTGHSDFPSNLTTLLINTMTIGSEKYIYGMCFEMLHQKAESAITWTGTNGTFLAIEQYDQEEDIQLFVEKISRISRCSCVISPSTRNDQDINVLISTQSDGLN